MEDGFKVMSQNADVGGSDTSRQGGSGNVAAQLKSYGVDTDQMTDAAAERASELQRLLIDEVRARPMRALGWAAAAGIVLGFWAAR